MNKRYRLTKNRLRRRWTRVAAKCVSLGVVSLLYYPKPVKAQETPPVTENSGVDPLSYGEDAEAVWGEETESEAVVTKRAFVSGIDKFTTAGGGCFNMDSLGNSRKGAEAVAAELSVKGWSVTTKHGTSALWRHWTDKTRTGNQSSADELYADKADLAYISTHGNWIYNPDGTALSTVFYTGKKDANLGCEIRTNRDIRWGNTEMDIVAIDACWSLDYAAFSRGIYDKISLVNDVTIALGFNGLSSDSIAHRDAVKAWIRASSDKPIAKTWVDKLTMTQTTNGVTRTDCAAAIIWAVDREEADLTYNNDNLGNYVPSQGGKAFYYFKKDCRADQGTALTFDPPRWRQVL